MEIRELNYLVAIAEEKSISRAAERLFMAQSSLSQSLNTLEHNLGAKLFVRTSRGVRPTEAGRIFIDYAYRTLSEYHRTKDEIQDLHELKKGKVIFGISTFRGSWLLPSITAAFHLDYPGIQVQIVEENSMALEQMLLTGDLDIALVVLPLSDPRIEPTFLMEDEICLITRSPHPVLEYARDNSGHPWSKIPRCVDLRDTKPFEYLLSPINTIMGREARRLFSKCGFAPVTCNEDVSALLGAAMGAAGQGLAFTYYSSRHYFREAEMLSLGADATSVRLGVALPPGRYHSKAALALREVLIQLLSL